MEISSKEELKDLRRRIKASWSEGKQIALMDKGAERLAQEAYDEFVNMHIELYKQEKAAAKEPAAQAAG